MNLGAGVWVCSPQAMLCINGACWGHELEKRHECYWKKLEPRMHHCHRGHLVHGESMHRLQVLSLGGPDQEVGVS